MATEEGRGSSRQRVVLWLEHLTEEEVPGLDLVADVRVPVGGDDGVVDIDGQTVTARSSNLVSLNTEAGDSPLETTLNALEETDWGSRSQ